MSCLNYHEWRSRIESDGTNPIERRVRGDPLMSKRLAFQAGGRMVLHGLGRGAVPVAVVGLLLGGTVSVRAQTAAEKAEAKDAGKGDTPRLLKGHTDWVWSVDLSPDGKTLVTGGGADDHTARVWNFAKGTVTARVDVRGVAYGVVLLPGGKRAAVASADKSIYVFDAESGRVLGRLQGHTGPVFGLATTRSGKVLVSVSEDGTARLWDMKQGAEVANIKVSAREVRAVAISPDGRWLLTGDFEPLGRLWDTATGREVARYEGHTKAVISVAFTPDGRRVVTGSEDKSVRLWDAESGRELGNFEGVTDRVYAVAVSPDGRRVAAGLADKKILLWDASRGRTLATIAVQGAGVLSLKFTPDGRQLVAGCGDGSVWVGHLPPPPPAEATAPVRTAPRGKGGRTKTKS